MRGVLVIAFVSALAGCGGDQKRRSLPGGEGPAASNTLFDRIGGLDPLRAIVDEWMLEIASDARINQYFESVDISVLKLRLAERLCVLLEGPCVYKGRDLDEAHASMKLTPFHLQAFIEDLEPALERVGVTGDEASAFRVRVRELAAEMAIQSGEE